MLTNRIIGAFTFRSGVYAEVERDKSFTQTAWIIVIVVAFLNQLGTNAGTGNLIGGTIGGTIGAVVGFALGAFILSLVGQTLFNAQVDFGEVVRTVGLAYVWQVFGVIGILAGVIQFILIPVICITWILGLIASFIAIREALDLDTGPTIIAVIVFFVVYIVVLIVVGIIFGIPSAMLGVITG